MLSSSDTTRMSRTSLDRSSDEKTIAEDGLITEGGVRNHPEIKAIKDISVLLAEDEDDFPDGGLRAWLVVIGGALGNAATFGYVNAWGEFQSYYEKTLLSDTSPSTIAWIGSIQYAFNFIPGLLLGQLFDKGHLKMPLAVASVLLVVTTLLIAECKVYWQFLLCQGFAVGLTGGSIYAPLVAVVAHWFKRRKGLALGVMAFGSSIGGTLFPIIVHNLIRTVGFQWTMRIVALILLCLLVGTNLMVARRLPPKANTSGRIFDLREFKSRTFSVYCLSTMVAFLGLYTMLTYINVSAEFAGVDPAFAEYLVSIMNGASSTGRVLSGYLGDRFGPLNVMAPSAFMAGVTTLIWPFLRTKSSFIVLAVFNGIFNGTYGSIISAPIISMGETQTVGLRVGMYFSVLAIGAVTGPPISGAINAATDGYKAAGYFAGSCLFLAVILMLTSRHLMLKGKLRGKA